MWKHEGLKAEHFNDKFNGFIELLSRENKILDIKELLIKTEKMFEQLPKKYFNSALSIYFLFNIINDEDNRLVNYEKIFDKYVKRLNECSIEFIVLSLYLSGLPEWSLTDQENIVDEYYKNKFRKQSIKLNTLVEIKVLSKIANQYLLNKNEEKYIEFVDKAIYESGNYFFNI